MALIEFVETDKELEKPAKKAPAKKSGSTSKRTSARKTAPKAAKTTAPEQAEADAAEAAAADVVAAAEETVDAAPAAAEETAAAAATEAESAGETAAVEQPAEETATAQPAEDEKGRKFASKIQNGNGPPISFLLFYGILYGRRTVLSHRRGMRRYGDGAQRRRAGRRGPGTRFRPAALERLIPAREPPQRASPAGLRPTAV